MRPFRSNLYLVKGERLVRYEVNAVMQLLGGLPGACFWPCATHCFGVSEISVAETLRPTPWTKGGGAGQLPWP